MVSAILRAGDRILLIKRSMAKKIAPGKWSPVGGHMEEGEISDPERACLREILEETGIEAGQIRGFRLRWIIPLQKEGELRLHFIFAGELDREISLLACEEGELFYLPAGEVLEKDMAFSMREAMRRYLGNPEEEGIFLGAVRKGESGIVWTEL
ncbi:MAG: NUDIX domain-containing protein [Christensenellaceae bacterium]|jgi:8-oxo-dGTP diphosphatase|nr:NUDIX domain-containing protein [Christensenellaceae bacterium]